MTTTASHTKQPAASIEVELEKKPRLTILPGMGLVDLDDPQLTADLAERLAGKVGDELILFAARMREGLSPPRWPWAWK